MALPRAAALALVCLAVGLAGCGGVSPGAPPESGAGTTATPAPVPTDRATLPPGVGEGGVHDGATLAAAHTDRVLDADSYTLSRNETTYWPNGTVGSRTSATVERNATTRRWRYRERSPVPKPTTGRSPAVVGRDIWGEGERAYLRERHADGTDRVRRLGGETFGSLRLFGLRLDANFVALFGGLEIRLAGRETVDGTTHYRLAGSDVTDSDRMDRAVPGWNVTDVSFEAVVAADGAIRRYRVAYTAVRPDAGRVRTVSVVRYDRVSSTTPRRPGWVPTDANASGSARLTLRPPSRSR